MLKKTKQKTTTDFLQWLKKTELYSELLQAITENSYGIILDFILAGVFRAWAVPHYASFGQKSNSTLTK